MIHNTIYPKSIIINGLEYSKGFLRVGNYVRKHEIIFFVTYDKKYLQIINPVVEHVNNKMILKFTDGSYLNSVSFPILTEKFNCINTVEYEYSNLFTYRGRKYLHRKCKTTGRCYPF